MGNNALKNGKKRIEKWETTHWKMEKKLIEKWETTHWKMGKTHWKMGNNALKNGKQRIKKWETTHWKMGNNALKNGKQRIEKREATHWKMGNNALKNGKQRIEGIECGNFQYVRFYCLNFQVETVKLCGSYDYSDHCLDLHGFFYDYLDVVWFVNTHLSLTLAGPCIIIQFK